MVKTIDTLVEDIQRLLVSKDLSQYASEMADELAFVVRSKLADEHEPRLRVSNLGKPCRRELWYSIRRPELAEPLGADNILKFMYGHILEAVMLFLAKVSGHTVQGEQDEIDLYGIKGHRDAVIDGMVVDVKSASKYSFDKFVSGLEPANDTFGYLTQLDSYVEAAAEDPVVTVKDRGGFLVVDKTLGKITLDIHGRQGIDYKSFVKATQEGLARDHPPPRGFNDTEYGKSGNRSLGVNCSYCRWKSECWPGLRGFAYSSGPVWFTKVVRLPDVPEIQASRSLSNTQTSSS